MAIDRSKLRKGGEAIDKANEDAKKNSGGSFKPFLSSIYWSGDGDEHYVLILNPVEEVPTVEYHPFVEASDGKPHSIIARTDPFIGEKVDPLERVWKYKSRLTNLAVAVVLEPVTEVVNGREKPTGFQVATRTFERKVRDDDGEPTGEVEEIEAPEIGLIAQSPMNFFNQLRSYDVEEAPLHTTPLKIKRIGANKSVSYTVVGYDQIDVDVSNLIGSFENVAYIGMSDGIEELIESVDSAGTDEEATTLIGDYVLDLKLEELADEDNYNELLDMVEKPYRYAEADKKSSTKSERPTRRERPSRGSRKSTEVAEDTAPAETAPEPKAEKTASKAEDRKAKLERLRQRASAKSE